MRLALVAVGAFVSVSGAVLAQDRAPQARSATGVPVAGGTSVDPTGKAVSGTAKPDVENRRGDAVDVRPQVTTPGASIPFPYTAATEPPREPYRRPVPCSPFARGTDGTTTCIGIDDRGSADNRRAAKPAPRAPTQISRRDVRPEPRNINISTPRRELTDPRFHQPPPEFVRAPQGGGGFLAFLGSVFSR